VVAKRVKAAAAPAAALHEGELEAKAAEQQDPELRRRDLR